MTERERHPIPGGLNLCLLALASGASGTLLWGASHAPSFLLRALCALGFSFSANTLFSLLHEAVHGILHPHRGLNRWCGRLAAAWFPTSLAMQRAFHLTHHRNNRGPLEQFDYVHPADKRWLKLAQWYAILTGLYWLIAAGGVIVYLLVPRALRLGVLRDADSRAAQQTSSRAYLAALDELDPVATRLEILSSAMFQAGLWVLLDLSLAGWALAYAAFALNWSSLQYADHAFSPLDPRDGAWNLRVHPLIRGLFLNYHFHLAHHRHPQVPWLHLGEHVANDEPQPSFLSVWLAMWRGPRPHPAQPEEPPK